jgi:hypothetical protein
MSDENIPRRYFYEVDSWVREQEHPRRRKRLNEDDLAFVDFVVFKIIPEDQPTDVSYITVYGPMEDWESIEGILAYDYGEEGSRLYPTAA